MAVAGRENVALVCKNCGSQNYITTRNKTDMEGKMEIKKFCKRCKTHHPHKEKTKLK